MESQPQNLEFRINPQNFHSCIIKTKPFNNRNPDQIAPPEEQSEEQSDKGSSCLLP